MYTVNTWPVYSTTAVHLCLICCPDARDSRQNYELQSSGDSGRNVEIVLCAQFLLAMAQ